MDYCYQHPACLFAIGGQEKGQNRFLLCFIVYVTLVEVGLTPVVISLFVRIGATMASDQNAVELAVLRYLASKGYKKAVESLREDAKVTLSAEELAKELSIIDPLVFRTSPRFCALSCRSAILCSIYMYI